LLQSPGKQHHNVVLLGMSHGLKMLVRLSMACDDGGLKSTLQRSMGRTISMRATHLLGIAALLLAAFPIPCKSVELETTIGQLYQLCKSESPENRSFCSGFIAGVSRMMITNQFIAQRMKSAEDQNVVWELSMCDQVPYADEVQAFVSWAEKHPENGTQAAVAAFMALHERWPCKR